jgi:putative transposase
MVWSSKYRYKELTGALRLRDTYRQACRENEVDILRGVLSSDHVHMFVSVSPKLGGFANHSPVDSRSFIMAFPLRQNLGGEAAPWWFAASHSPQASPFLQSVQRIIRLRKPSLCPNPTLASRPRSAPTVSAIRVISSEWRSIRLSQPNIMYPFFIMLITTNIIVMLLSLTQIKSPRSAATSCSDLRKGVGSRWVICRTRAHTASLRALTSSNYYLSH